LSDLLRRNDHGRWCPHGHVGTGFSHETLKELHGKLIKLKAAKSPFAAKVKDDAVTTWVKPKLVAEVKFTEWISSGEVRHPVYPGLRADKRAADVFREPKSSLSFLAKFTSLRLEQDSCMRDFASGSRERSLPTSSARFKT